jgi:hypothetical protein
MIWSGNRKCRNRLEGRTFWIAGSDVPTAKTSCTLLSPTAAYKDRRAKALDIFALGRSLSNMLPAGAPFSAEQRFSFGVQPGSFVRVDLTVIIDDGKTDKNFKKHTKRVFIKVGDGPTVA